MKMEIEISIDTTEENNQIYISDENSTGCSYTIGQGMTVNDAVLKALKHYLEFNAWK